MASLILNLVFGIALVLFCHYVDGPVTTALKQELKELEKSKHVGK